MGVSNSANERYRKDMNMNRPKSRNKKNIQSRCLTSSRLKGGKYDSENSIIPIEKYLIFSLMINT